MLRRAILPLLLLLAALTVPACGGSGEPGALRPWRAEAPYLPPPDPSGYQGSVRAPVTIPPQPRSSSAPKTSTTAGAPSDAQIRAELRQAYGGESGDDLDQATLDTRGLAVIPETAPPRLVALMHAANDVARKPYVYGGGHGRNAGEIWSDSAYDCSGSVSYALAAAGYIRGPMVSGALATWGRPGPGRWVSIFANDGHAFMVVAGLRFDTSGRQVTGTRWQAAGARSYAGFSVRHPPGL